jgi:cytochrome c biogenesis protein CcdA/glutaredoxin
MMRLIPAAIAAFLLVLAGADDAAAQRRDAAPDILVYSHPQCPYCQQAKRYLTELQEQHPTLVVRIRELSDDRRAAGDLQALARARGIQSAGVPAMLIGGERLVLGFDGRTTPREVEKALRQMRLPASEYMDSSGDAPAAGAPAAAGVADVGGAQAAATLRLPLIGEVDAEAMALPATTALIAFVDGFNPCSLWVLTFLLGIVIYSGSRRRIALVGLTFLAVTSAAYGIFMLGLFSTLQYMSYMPWVTGGVAMIALLFALVNIKDYFWFQQGLSLTISDRHKPGIHRRVRDLMNPGRSLPALVGGTAMLALGVTVVEMPCTAGFPMLWSGIVAAREVGTGAFAGLFSLYLGIYLLDELLVFGVAVVTMRRSRLEEKHGRVLKLVGGMVMLALAVALLLAPGLMHSLAGTLAVFTAAAAVSALVLLLHRLVLPRFGIVIGSEQGMAPAAAAAGGASPPAPRANRPGKGSKGSKGPNGSKSSGRQRVRSGG